MRWSPGAPTAARCCSRGRTSATPTTTCTCSTSPAARRGRSPRTAARPPTRAGIPAEALAEPRLVRYPAFDGLEIPALLYLPRGAQLPLPVVVHVHGGPEGQARPMLNPTIQYLVHRGFGVLAPNVRGSTGYGK